jgi:hypothetical protein
VEFVENVVEYIRSGYSDGIESSDNGSRFDRCIIDFENKCEE